MHANISDERDERQTMSSSSSSQSVSSLSEREMKVLEWFSDEVVQNYNISTISEQIHHDRKIFQPVRPPYMNIPDQLAAKEALKDAYSDGSFLLLYTDMQVQEKARSCSRWP